MEFLFKDALKSEEGMFFPSQTHKHNTIVEKRRRKEKEKIFASMIFSINDSTARVNGITLINAEKGERAQKGR